MRHRDAAALRLKDTTTSQTTTHRHLGKPFTAHMTLHDTTIRVTHPPHYRLAARSLTKSQQNTCCPQKDGRNHWTI
eukprot:7800837-Pyramimonas_sp.AAC.1